jgi:aspartate/methionine/tyrosine aminotransferase
MLRVAMSPARRAASIEPFQVMSILERAKALEAQGRDVIHMEVGEPRFPLPDALVEAARRAVAEESMGYTPSAGLPALRRAIAARYGERYGLDVDPARVLVTPGGSGALQLALGSALDVSDGVLVTDPGYPCHRHMASLVGAEVCTVPLDAADGWQLDESLVSAHWANAVRALMLASPANPTGAVIDPDSMRRIHAGVSARGGMLIVDETYQGLVYDAEDHTALACGNDVAVVNSFSKYFGLTGWRLGWLVAPEGHAAVAERLAQNLYLAPSTLAQHVALEALGHDLAGEFEQRRAVLRQRRDLMFDGLSDLGFGIATKPHGAFYLFASVPPGRCDGVRFARELLEREGVAVTPGSDFGSSACGSLLRFAYTAEDARLREALIRLQRFLD